jgi:cellulose biosynthesis protein BcsQ
MPLQGSHVFASHIGHTGKTTLCFQVASHYAKKHPNVSVLVMDLTEEGDLTKRLLGGVDSAQEKVDELFGGVHRLLADTKNKTEGMTKWLWKRDVDITAHVLRVADHNDKVPPNLYLVSSGAWPTGEEPMTSDARKRLSSKILESLNKTPVTWRLFCDTDGDRRPSAFTMLAYSLCPEAIVPLHLNKADLDRTETMLWMLQGMRESNEIDTQVLMVVWNFVKALKDEPCHHQGRLGELQLPFTPTKVSLDILDACNARLHRISQQLPGLFKHGCEEVSDFMRSSMLVQRQMADNVLKPSEELGLPFVHMVEQLGGRKSLKFKSGDVEYQASDSVINGVSESVETLWAKMEAMSLD